MSKSIYKKIMTENTVVKVPKKDSGVISNNKDALDFFTSRKVFGSMNEDFWETPPNFSNPEAKLHLDSDIKKMSKILGKASHQIIKIMMDGVKGGKYDALDIQRGIKVGPINRTHEGERPFISMLWNKVRDGFRRYSKNKKLR